MAILRIDKILSSMGIATRSEVRVMVRQERIAADGIPVRSADAKVDPAAVRITVDGAEIRYQEHCYLMMNKPAGVVTARSDRRERTVLDLLEGRYQNLGLFPAGRLDKDAQGLLLLTNDGAFCHNVISPKKHVPKTYELTVDGMLTAADADRIAAGITLDDGTVFRPGKLEILEAGEESRALMTIDEGKYHQVKRMIAACGKMVICLKRISIGGLTLDPTLKIGDFRELLEEEKRKIFPII